jgi:hypothetical protein
VIDIGSISAGISPIKVAIEIAKELKNVTSSLDEAEVKLNIAQLLEAMSEGSIKTLSLEK